MILNSVSVCLCLSVTLTLSLSPYWLSRQTDGQTNSGKTHTIIGETKRGSSEGEVEQGLVYLALVDIFSHIENDKSRDYSVQASMVEIYNEVVRDLTCDVDNNVVEIREDPKTGIYCTAQSHKVDAALQMILLMKKGLKKRAIEMTSMNDCSSRSHTIFTVTLESKPKEPSANNSTTLLSTLALVDLAGLESVKTTNNTGMRAKEGAKINQSLLSLGKVITALSRPAELHINFRDSKLTRLLQPNLNVDSKIAFVCCINPSDRYIESTRSTLQFASRAKIVKTRAVVNEVVNDTVKVKQLQLELERLKEMLCKGADRSCYHSQS